MALTIRRSGGGADCANAAAGRTNVAVRISAETMARTLRMFGLQLDDTVALTEFLDVHAGLVEQRDHQVRQRRALGHLDVPVALVPAGGAADEQRRQRSEEHTSELQSRLHLVCRLLLEK